MYTLEEIKQEAKSAQFKAIPWMLLMDVLALGCFYFCTKMEFAHYNPYNQHIVYYIIVCMLFLFIIIAGCLPHIAYSKKKKQLEEENAEEDRKRHEEHLKHIEELLNNRNSNV